MSLYSVTLLEIIKSANRITSISSADMSYKTTHGKWSKKEILGHLIDSAYNNHARFLMAQKQDNLQFQGYDQVEWVARNNYQQQDHQLIFNTWSEVNAHLLRLIGSIPSQVLQDQTKDHNFHQICFNLLSEGIPSNLSYLIWDYLDHVEHHLSQIIPGYKKCNPVFVG